jgi:hypothetical protein
MRWRTLSDAPRTGKRRTHHDRATIAPKASGLVQESLDATSENSPVHRTFCCKRACRRGMARRLL